MKKKLIYAMCLMVMPCMMKAQVKPAIPQDPAIEQMVEAKLAQMSLDEKVGQMLELNLDLMGSTRVTSEIKIDRAKLKGIMEEYDLPVTIH